MSKLGIVLIAGLVAAGTAGVTVYVVTRSDPEPTPTTQPGERSVEVARAPGAVRVGKLASGRVIGEVVWTASGELVGMGPSGGWVRVSTSTGASRPFSSAFTADKGQRPVRALGADVLYTISQPLAGVSGFGLVAADGRSVGRGVVSYPDLKSYRLLDAREAGGQWQLLLRKPLRTQDDEIYVASGGPTWQHARVAGVPKDHVFMAADANWTLFVSRRARVGGPPLLNEAGGRQVGVLPASAETAQIRFSPDGRYLAIRNARQPGSSKGSLLVAEADNPARVQRIRGGVDWFGQLAWSPDSRHIAVTIQTDSGGGVHSYALHLFAVK